jgi:hypothetical protein
MIDLKVLISLCSFVSPTETSLHSKHVRYLQLAPHSNSGCLLFRHTVGEPTVFKAEKVAKFREQEGKKSSWVGSIRETVTVHEDILVSTMPVQITIKYDFSFLTELSHKPFHCWVFRVKSFRGVFPTTIQILAYETTSIVSIDYTVRVKHRHDFEHKVISQKPSFWLLTRQKLQNAFHNPWAVALARMNSSRNKDSLLSLLFVLFFHLRRDCDAVALVPSNCASQFLLLVVAIAARPLFNLSEVLLQVRKRIRVAMREVHSVKVIFKGVDKR